VQGVSSPLSAIFPRMDLGRLDVCLRVKDARSSRTFYESLGFRRVEGEDAKGWAVVVNGVARIGLFEAAHMGADAFSLNFRGANMATIAAHLQLQGYSPEGEAVIRPDGTGSINLRDPDGHLIFFDTAPGETKKT
jgi:catechol 2,3-dioxygenase-like lactoylglutathione lyase family enzyme